MKLTIIIMTSLLLQVSAITHAQITLSEKNMPFESVIKNLKTQSGYDFFYNGYDIKHAKPVTLNLKNVSLADALKACFADQNLTYVIEDRTVVIKAEDPTFLERVVATLSNIDIIGRVTDENNNALPGAIIKVKGTNRSTSSNDKGEFFLGNVDEKAVLIITYVGYETREIPATKDLGVVALKLANNILEEVNVTVSTGYQTLPKERATGSFSFVDNKLLNRSVSTNVLDRLDGVTSGVFFNKQNNKTGGLSSRGGDPSISIRGRSTLFANTEPLIVLDNFPYDGDLKNINPNDIESITVLKDAAAASIWGVRAGNGVIVLTSKKGKANQIPCISFNTNVTITGKPDIYSIPRMTSREYIEMEKYWFDKGRYNAYLNNPNPYFAAFPISPVIDILDREKKGLLSQADAELQLDKLRNIDSRDDYAKYFLRNAIKQQYALNVSGGSGNHQYFLSGGYDRNLDNIVSNSYNRINLTANNSFSFLNDRLKLDANILFTKSNTRSNPDPYSYTTYEPYTQLVDENGHGLSVTRDFRPSGKDNFKDKGLLDWNYYPYEERLNDNNVSKLTDYRLGLRLNYKILPKSLDVDLNYQYQQGNLDQNAINGLNVYTTRNTINSVTQISPEGILSYPIPLGAIVNFNTNTYHSNWGRMSLNYHQLFGLKHDIVVLAGVEIKDYNSFNRYSYLYGYNEATATSVPVDYFTNFIRPIDGQNFRISNQDSQDGSTDRFLSYFANASYTYDNKYILSASVRKDESNLFGVDANKKGVPLYSVGLSWLMNKEDFYPIDFLPYLRLRLTDGYNGNLSKNLSAYTTAKVDGVNPYYNVPQQIIVNPPNPMLRWEKVHVINGALDFGLRNNILTGSIEFYSKKGEDLIGDSPIAAQTGVVSFRGNTANILTKGIDLTLNSINLKGNFGWATNFLFNYVKDKVTDYKMQTGVNRDYVNQNFNNPFVGKPYSSIFAYPWGGLDVKGDPQGYFNGVLSKDYRAILNSTNPGNLKYIGTGSPTIFGSVRNNFQYKQIELSFNIIYKMGYYFRRGGFNPSGASGQVDYANRWQKPGDEKTTNVPALIYPGSGQRDEFYRGSEILIEKGDHIRLQDIQLSYTISNNHHKLPFRTLKLYGYASNLGIIWAANKKGLDPDYTGNGSYAIAVPKTFAIGLTANF